jgi:hypothetical protein
MPEIISTPPSASSTANLEKGPPTPDLQAAKPQGSLMTSGMGPNAAQPQAMALQGMAMIEQGAKLLGAVLPGAAAATADMISTLRQAVAQQVGQMAGGSGGPVPGAGPGGPPPPAMPQGTVGPTGAASGM